MILIGVYAARKVKNSEDYVLAGRSLPFYMALSPTHKAYIYYFLLSLQTNDAR
jgi:Na+/proline symporter